MGAVYEAYDRERNRRVAVKTLLRFDPGALYLFKQEFRTLANLLHPNLVRLYDLVATESDGVFFTMELVSGRHFCDYVWPPDARVETDDSRATVARPCARAVAIDESGAVPMDREPRAETDERRTSPADIGRLRDALRQLVEGVHAAHVAGKVHRDIKPSNVLVGDDGRVVLLDFGVAAELSRAVDRRLLESHVVGTPMYMAPEQALDEAPTPASDWYSVGVLVYEALVGKPPFAGDGPDALYRKAVLDPAAAGRAGRRSPDRSERALLRSPAARARRAAERTKSAAAARGRDPPLSVRPRSPASRRTRRSSVGMQSFARSTSPM